MINAGDGGFPQLLDTAIADCCAIDQTGTVR
jgi:hypothetical protein